MRVIGTAGHVDHGKSTLVEALTGIHPDRLKEEREREMTIDLGFAWLILPEGEEVGIIDVPGHRDFIENMLAGVGGIDAALFVVAADEGVMPQTREHLAILDILQIQAGVVALTKIDLVDEEWIELVEDDLRKAFANTVLENAPIMRVSARTNVGIPELLNAIDSCLADRPPRPDMNRPRLPIDRVFSIAGFGTVVTGTLVDGQFRVGDEVVILPHELRCRIRGLQTHKHKAELAVPGSRTAINISGIAVDQIKRGEVIAHPGDYRCSRRLDVNFRLLEGVSQSLKHNLEVKLFIGSDEVLARARLLGVDELMPGDEGWLQLELNRPSIAARGDHYILRRPSPGETLGGGMVIDPHPKSRHKRFSTETIENLKALSRGYPPDVLLQAVTSLKAAPLKDVIVQSNLDIKSASEAFKELVSTGVILILDPPVDAEDTSLSQVSLKALENHLITSRSFWNQLSSQAIRAVREYHHSYPLRIGMPREELKSRIKPLTSFSPRLFNSAIRKLVSENSLVESGPLLLIPGHVINYSPQQQNKIDALMVKFISSPSSPPSVKECQTLVGEDVYLALIDQGRLVAVSTEVVFRKEDYNQIVAELRTLFIDHGALTAAQVRDHFNTSRKYVLALLEHLDSIGVTTREGDFRRLKN